MNIENLFIYASKQKLRFESNKGQLSVEDLWDLELVSNRPNQSTLDSIAIQLSKELESTKGVTSFVTTSPTKNNKQLQAKFDIVLYIIEQKKQDDIRNANIKLAKEKNKKILEIIQEKQDGELKSKSVEELLQLMGSSELVDVD